MLITMYSIILFTPSHVSKFRFLMMPLTSSHKYSDKDLSDISAHSNGLFISLSQRNDGFDDQPTTSARFRKCWERLSAQFLYPPVYKHCRTRSFQASLAMQIYSSHGRSSSKTLITVEMSVLLQVDVGGGGVSVASLLDKVLVGYVCSSTWS